MVWPWCNGCGWTIFGWTSGVPSAGSGEGVICSRRSKSDDGMSGILAKSVDKSTGPITYWKAAVSTLQRIGRYGMPVLLFRAVKMVEVRSCNGPALRYLGGRANVGFTCSFSHVLLHHFPLPFLLTGRDFCSDFIVVDSFHHSQSPNRFIFLLNHGYRS